MSKNKWKSLTAALLLAVLIAAGFIAIAAEYGTKDDPLVSLSYIENVLEPQIADKVDKVLNEKLSAAQSELDSKINSVSGMIEDKVGQYASKSADEIVTDAFVESVAAKVSEKGTSGGASSTFALIDLPAGKTLTAKVGCEMVLRVGSATCVASGSPGLIDLTTGGDLAGGKALEKNHLYLCTIEGRGVKATANAKLLVRGPYSIN